MRITVYSSHFPWNGDLQELQRGSAGLKHCTLDWKKDEFILQKISTQRYEFIYPRVKGIIQSGNIVLHYSYSLLTLLAFLLVAVIIPVVIPLLLYNGDELATTIIALSSVLVPFSLFYFGGAVAYMHRFMKNLLTHT